VAAGIARSGGHAEAAAAEDRCCVKRDPAVVVDVLFILEGMNLLVSLQARVLHVKQGTLRVAHDACHPSWCRCKR
jgi:hypothetical protein